MHSALPNKRAWSPNKQRGATLVTVMIIMVMITLLGLTAMRMGMSSLTLATNSQVSNLLFQASDVGMVEFANTVESAAFKGKADIGAGPLAALAAVDVRDIPVTVALFLRAMSQASIRSRVRPELLITTTQSPGPKMDALITCMWPSL